MKLKTVQITNFRSIEDSDEVNIDDVTCLVGKNESGKTAFLRALHLLRPLNPLHGKKDYEDTIDYPSKNFTKYKRTRREHPAEVVQVKFGLSDKEVEAVENEFGKG